VNINDAAIALQNNLQHQRWLITIGIGTSEADIPTLFVYVTNLRLARQIVPKTWTDFPVALRGASRPKVNHYDQQTHALRRVSEEKPRNCPRE
jgi:hypothetical protein